MLELRNKYFLNFDDYVFYLEDLVDEYIDYCPQDSQF